MTVYSVIIPTFNEEEAIGKTVTSILRQVVDHPCELEVIVVDDNSTDRTVEVAEEAGAKVIINDGSLPTISALRNRGAQDASAESVLGFVDGDMDMPDDWLQTALNYMNNDQVDALGCLCEVPANAPWIARTWSEDERRRGKPVWEVDYLPGRNIVVRKESFDKVQGFDTQMETAEDKDFTYRLKQAGYKVVQVDRPRAMHLGFEPNLWVYLKKEFWRQKSALTFARKNGYSFRTLRNPLLSLWHLFFMIATLIAVVMQLPALIWGSAAFCWVLPSFLISLRATAKPIVFARLLFLTFLRWHMAGFGLLVRLVRPE